MKSRDDGAPGEATSAADMPEATAPLTRLSSFDYGAIPEGHYDRVLREGNPIRRLWHLSKFERVLDYLPSRQGQSLLDIGCFAGSFLGMATPERFSRQLGVDILPAQIAYARAHYGTPYRHFQHIESITALSDIEDRFDCVTLIEVIEHLGRSEIHELLAQTAALLKPGGHLVLSTPNYASTWPLLEWLLNRFSDVSYEEQHVTRFTAFNVQRRLAEIYSPLDTEFEVILKTTTHFVTPFLAGISFGLAHQLSRLVPHGRWRLPFGNLVLLGLRRRP
jgi:2-polyprenyl-3-methyl-5-hydroxy-6-metoxy-1,4-benzoquinol methylase